MNDSPPSAAAMEEPRIGQVVQDEDEEKPSPVFLPDLLAPPSTFGFMERLRSDSLSEEGEKEDAEAASKAFAFSGITPRPPEEDSEDDEEERDEPRMIAIKHVEKHAFLLDQTQGKNLDEDAERTELLRLENSRLVYIARRRAEMSESAKQQQQQLDAAGTHLGSKRSFGTSIRSLFESSRNHFRGGSGGGRNNSNNGTGSNRQNRSVQVLPPSFTQNGKQRAMLLALMKTNRFEDAGLREALLCKRPLHPEGEFRFYWDWLLILAVVYTLIVVPFEVAFFSTDDYNEGLIIAGCVLDIIFILDLGLSFRTSYQGIDDEFVVDSRKICRHYLRTWFVFDLIAALPINIIQLALHEDQSSFFAFAKLLKFFRIFRLRHFFQKLAGHRVSTAIYLVILFTFYVIVAHWAACIFWLIAVQEGLENSWTVPLSNDVANRPISVQYATAMAWSVTTITTLGYGDIHPVTYAEQIYTTIFVILGAFLYASIIGLVSFIIRRQFSSELKKEFFFKELQSFGRQYKLTPKLQRRIHRYYEFLYDRTKNSSLAEEQEIVNQDLPLELRGDIANSMHRKLIHSNALLRQCTTLGFRQVLAARLNPSAIRSPHDVLFFVGDAIQEVVFINKGLVELVVDMDMDEREMVVYRAGDGQHCGELGLFDSTRAHALSCLVVEFTDFNTIYAHDLMQIFDMFPRERKLFEAVAKERWEKIEGLIHERNAVRELLLQQQQNAPAVTVRSSGGSGGGKPLWSSRRGNTPPFLSRRGSTTDAAFFRSSRRGGGGGSPRPGVPIPRLGSRRGSDGGGSGSNVFSLLSQRGNKRDSTADDFGNRAMNNGGGPSAGELELAAFRTQWERQMNLDFDLNLVKRVCAEVLAKRTYGMVDVGTSALEPGTEAVRSPLFSSNNAATRHMRSSFSSASPPSLSKNPVLSPEPRKLHAFLGSESSVLEGNGIGEAAAVLSSRSDSTLMKEDSRSAPNLRRRGRRAMSLTLLEGKQLSGQDEEAPPAKRFDVLGAMGTKAVTAPEQKLAELVKRLEALQAEYAKLGDNPM